MSSTDVIIYVNLTNSLSLVIPSIGNKSSCFYAGDESSEMVIDLLKPFDKAAHS
jgi:hypothetical protein